MTDLSSVCEFCDMALATCIHGSVSAAEEDRRMRGGYRGATDLTPDGPTIIATQKGPCPGCDEQIEEGEAITHTYSGWVHETCTDRPVEVEPPKTDASIFYGIE